MKSYIVEATVLDEVCIAERHSAGNEYMGLDHIPGSTWWGGVAALTGIRPGITPSENFCAVFYSGDVVFTNLYPMFDEILRSHHIPLSARTPKFAPGFKHEADPLFVDEVNGETQHLFPDGVMDWLLNGTPGHFDSGVEGISGWYAGEPPDCRSVNVSMVLRGHHERSALSGVPREGNLFSRQNIARGEKFQGALRATTPEGEAALEWLVNEYLQGLSVELSVGRQPGRLKIDLQENLDTLLPWQKEPAVDTENREDYVSLTLLSDAILPDKWLRPHRHIPGNEVENACGNRVEVSGPESHFSAVREIMGWNGAYSRPRESEWAIVAGSAFLYTMKWSQDVPTEERMNILTAFQSRGIGLRRSEGFGEIRINDPFHWK